VLKLQNHETRKDGENKSFEEKSGEWHYGDSGFRISGIPKARNRVISVLET
jgi:hypothetical protein